MHPSPKVYGSAIRTFSPISKHSSCCLPHLHALASTFAPSFLINSYPWFMVQFKCHFQQALSWSLPWFLVFWDTHVFHSRQWTCLFSNLSNYTVNSTFHFCLHTPSRELGQQNCAFSPRAHHIHSTVPIAHLVLFKPNIKLTLPSWWKDKWRGMKTCNSMGGTHFKRMPSLRSVVDR